MPKKRPPYLLREITRHGKIVWYVRIGKGARIRLKHIYGTQSFVEEYKNAISLLERGEIIEKRLLKPKKNSLKELIYNYYGSANWNNLAKPTKRQRELIFEKLIAKSGDMPYLAINKKHIQAAIDKQRDTPASAINFLKALSGLFNWASEQDLIEINPTSGVKRPQLKNDSGLKAWTEEDIEAYYKCWPASSKERVWLDVLLYTGLRRGDATRIGWKNVNDNVLHLKTEKSRFKTDVFLPILPVLQASLEIGQTGEHSFICGSKGEAFTKESFGNAFRKACDAAGINKSAHGVRKIAATRAANAGATVAQLKAIFGWTSDDMASLYTKTADRKRLALDAINKLSIN